MNENINKVFIYSNLIWLLVLFFIMKGKINYFINILDFNLNIYYGVYCFCICGYRLVLRVLIGKIIILKFILDIFLIFLLIYKVMIYELWL